MEDKKSNIILGIILTILMIIAIAIVIINPNKVETVNYATNQDENNSEKTAILNSNKANNEKLEKEEKQISMQQGKTFCKIGTTAVFYEEENNSIYTYNTDEKTTKKLAEVPNGAEKIYFDGENIYTIPSYYDGKGIYKIDLSGTVTKIYEGSSLQLWITDNKIYFVNQIGYDSINQNPQGTLCSMDKDGTNITNIAEKIKNYLKIKLELELNDKTQIFKSNQGVNFCGYKINEYRLKLRDRGKKAIKQKVRYLKEEVQKGNMSSKEASRFICGHLGYMKYANTRNLEEKLFYIN